MNRKEGIIVTIVVLATFITGVFASASASQVLNVFVTNFPKTHVGQDPASLVTLRCGYLPTIVFDLFCWRSHSDGTLTQNFTVPVGMVLVVTDVDWSASGGANSTVSFVMRLRQYQLNQHSFVYYSYAVADANGFAFKDEHLTTGFVVSPGTTLQAIGPGNLLVMLYGYLVKTG